MSTELKGPLRELLDDPVDHESLERVRRRVHASRRLPPRSGWARAPLAAAALVLLAAGGVFAWAELRGAGPLDGPGGVALATARGEGDAVTAVPLADGSTIWLDEGTAIEALVNDGERLELTQSDGRAVYHVRPGGPRRWLVRAGALEVEVVGTRFSIVRRGARVRVELERGHVVVRGDEIGERHLAPGEHVEVGAPEPVAAAPVQLPAPVPVQLPVEAPVEQESPPAASRPPREAAAWRALADRGRYRDAFAALGEAAHGEASRASASEDELFALADTARLGGHPRHAVTPLRRLVDEHRSAVAALTLGRLQLDALDDPTGAARTLAQADALGVPEELRESLLARRVEAHRRAGELERARQLAEAYLRAHPEGRYTARIRSFLAGP